TGHRPMTIDAGSIVDAAHIQPFAVSRNNDVRNGIALTKNMHWAFDEGLWSVEENYRIIVATQAFEEACPDSMALVTYVGKSLRLPRERSLWPNPAHFSWHLRHRYCELE